MIYSIKDSKIRVYDPLKTEAQQTYSGHGQTVCALAVNKATQTLVSGSWDKTVKVWRGAWGSLEKKNTKTISQIHQGNFSIQFFLAKDYGSLVSLKCLFRIGVGSTSSRR